MGFLSQYLNHSYAWLMSLTFLVSSAPLFMSFAQNLEYEYVLLVSIALPMVLTVLGCMRPRETHEVWWIELSFTALVLPLILMLPGVFAFSFELCRCSPAGFAFWSLMLGLSSCFLAMAAFELSSYLRRSISAVRVTILMTFVFLFLLLLAVVRFWIFPQVRIHDVWLGFLHGPIYDLWLPVDHGIFLMRLFLTLFAASLWLGALSIQIPPLRRAGFGCLVVSLIGGALSVYLPSAGSGASQLQAQLPLWKETANYRVYMTPQGDAARKDRWLKELNFHVNELLEIMGTDRPVVDIYVYENRETKKLWFGGGATDVADVFTPSIHISLDSAEPHPTLRHELVHAFAAKRGYWGIGFHPNMAITEGLAMALAPQEEDLHAQSAALLHAQRFPKLSTLLSPLFWLEPSRTAYTVAGSLMLYLIDKFGFAKVEELYSGSSFHVAFGVSKRELLKQWIQFLKSSYPKPMTEDLATEQLYRDPGLFSDFCPHSRIDLRQDRAHSVYTRLRQPLSWDPIRDYRIWRLGLQPDSKQVRLDFWKDDIKELMMSRPLRMERVKLWQRAIRQYREFPPRTNEDIELALLESDLLRIQGEIGMSQSILKQLQETSYRFYFGRNLNRQINARLAIESSLTSGEALTWRRYLAGWTTDVPEGKASAWILRYLRLRRPQATEFDDVSYLDFVSRDDQPALEVHKDFRQDFLFEWYKELAYRFAKLKKTTEAQEQLEKALKYGSAETSRQWWQQEIRRLAAE